MPPSVNFVVIITVIIIIIIVVVVVVVIVIVIVVVVVVVGIVIIIIVHVCLTLVLSLCLSGHSCGCCWWRFFIILSSLRMLSTISTYNCHKVCDDSYSE